jgi:hypothetical protein
MGKQLVGDLETGLPTPNISSSPPTYTESSPAVPSGTSIQTPNISVPPQAQIEASPSEENYFQAWYNKDDICRMAWSCPSHPVEPDVRFIVHCHNTRFFEWVKDCFAWVTDCFGDFWNWATDWLDCLTWCCCYPLKYLCYLLVLGVAVFVVLPILIIPAWLFGRICYVLAKNFRKDSWKRLLRDRLVQRKTRFDAMVRSLGREVPLDDIENLIGIIADIATASMWSNKRLRTMDHEEFSKVFFPSLLHPLFDHILKLVEHIKKLSAFDKEQTILARLQHMEPLMRKILNGDRTDEGLTRLLDEIKLEIRRLFKKEPELRSLVAEVIGRGGVRE